MAFFYSKGAKTNVIASLEELEEAVAILTGALVSRTMTGTAGADFRRFANTVADAVASGGKIHVIVRGSVGKTPLSETPEPTHARVTKALAFFARLRQAAVYHENVEIIG